MANKTLGEIAKRHTLWAVEHLTEATGYPPTFREVAEVLGLSTNATWNRLVRLRQDGRVAWVDGVPRTLRVPKAIFRYD